MKKKILFILLILSSSIGFAFAQSVSTTPAPAETATVTPAPAKTAAMSLPPQTQAAFVAGQIIQRMTELLNNIQAVIDNGVPVQENGQPAISAKDIQAALGTENVMRIRSALAILANGTTPSPTPAGK